MLCTMCVGIHTFSTKELLTSQKLRDGVKRKKIKQNADIKAFSFSSKPSKTKSAMFFGPRHWDNEATLPMNTMPACSSFSSQLKLGFSVADRRRRYIETTGRQFPYKDSLITFFVAIQGVFAPKCFHWIYAIGSKSLKKGSRNERIKNVLDHLLQASHQAWTSTDSVNPKMPCKYSSWSFSYCSAISQFLNFGKTLLYCLKFSIFRGVPSFNVLAQK